MAFAAAEVAGMVTDARTGQAADRHEGLDGPPYDFA